jgi:hypothetical protein
MDACTYDRGLFTEPLIFLLYPKLTSCTLTPFSLFIPDYIAVIDAVAAVVIHNVQGGHSSGPVVVLLRIIWWTGWTKLHVNISSDGSPASSSSSSSSSSYIY